MAMYVLTLLKSWMLSRMILLYRLDGMYQNLLLPPRPSVTRLSSTAIDHPDHIILGPLDMHVG